MEHETKIFNDHNLIINTVSGEVTVDESKQEFYALFANHDYDGSMRGLCDLTNATSRLHRSEFQDLADELGERDDFGEARWAIVTNNPLLTEFAQIFQRRVGELGSIRVFSTMETAEHYLVRPILNKLK